MGLTVAAAALAVALADRSLINRLRAAAPLITRAGALLLLAAGGYVAYDGWWETRVFAGAAGDPVIDTAADVQQWLATTLDRAGPIAVAAAVTALVAVGLATAWVTTRRGRTPADP